MFSASEKPPTISSGIKGGVGELAALRSVKFLLNAGKTQEKRIVSFKLRVKNSNT